MKNSIQSKAFAWISLILVLASCQTNKESGKISNQAESFKSIPIELNGPKARLSDLVEEVEIIRLEETDESLMGMVWDLSLEGDYIVIPTDDRRMLYIFNSKGDFVSQFDRHGDGPEEYNSVTSYWIKSDTLFLFDLYRKKLLEYSIQGDYLGETSTAYLANAMYELNDRYWLDLSFRAQEDSTAGQLASVDKGLKNPEYHLGALGDIDFPMGAPLNSFSAYGNSLLYHQLLSDSVYQIKDGQVKPYLHFDLQGQFFWTSEDMKSTGESPINMIAQSDKVWLLIPRIDSEWIHLNFNVSFGDIPAPNDLLYHRPSDNSIGIDVLKRSGERFEISFSNWYDDRLLASVSSSDIGEFLEELDESQISYTEGGSLQLIESSENPALMLIRFKSDF